MKSTSGLKNWRSQTAQALLINLNFLTIQKSSGVPLTRPSGTLSPSEGERDGVRGPLAGSGASYAHKVRTILTLIAGACLIGLGPLAAQESTAAKPADDKKAEKPAEKSDETTSEYSNWVTLGVGSTFIDGDKASFMRRHQIPKGPFGGVEDFHWEEAVGKKGLFQIDGHGIFDNHDYSVRLELSDPDKGYLRAGYTEFRTWYDGSGGFYPQNRQWFSLYNEELHVDRGEAWFEGGLTLPDLPVFTFRYAHEFRKGQKDSTEWGDSTLTVPPPNVGTTRAIVPTFLNIDEKRDIFEGDIKHTLGKTDLGAGVRYEIIDNDNSRNIHRRPNEPTADRYVTQKEGLDEDLFNVHGFSETRFNDKLWLTLGGSFTTLDTDTSGSRIYGTSYDPLFDPVYLRHQANDHGYLNLSGGANMKQYVGNLNLMITPLDNFTIVPAVRIEKQEMDGFADFLDTTFVSAAPLVPAVTNQLYAAASRDFLEVSESLEARYTGVKNWAFYARGEWSQTDGNQNETENTTTPLLRDTDWHRLNQKYIGGANWYPLNRMNLGAQYYYKVHSYDYDHNVDSTLNTSGDRYPAFLTDQNFTTHDANFRVTWRPLSNVSTVTRYDFQLSTVDTTGDLLAKVQSAEITSHIISESIGWTPLARLYLQISASYALDSTDTPAANATGTNQVVLNGANDYWNASLMAGYALSEKTDLQGQYFYYRANNYVDNSFYGQPYGAQGEEHGVTASLIHRFSKRVRGTLKYGFFRNRDTTSGGFNNYDAHLVYASMQYRF
ncbi:MAG TPA: hypothetical protein VEL06_12340 [Haliangiales bacterium]|nr:hypothetical protein [Haliangiales bacterium]